MKYALNMSPKVDSVVGLPVLSVTSTGGQNYLTLTYTQVISATDITYTVEASGDMQTWSSGSGATKTVSATNNADGKTQTVVVQDLTPVGSVGTRFMHLKVAKP